MHAHEKFSPSFHELRVHMKDFSSVGAKSEEKFPAAQGSESEKKVEMNKKRRIGNKNFTVQ